MQNLKLFVMDVDGTLTDGKIHIGPNGEDMKSFNVKDGYGIAQILPKHNVIPVIITGRESEIVKFRANELNIKYLFQGVSDKLSLLKSLSQQLNVNPEEIAYIGDDLNDLDCIDYCGITACPNDSVSQVLSTVDYISAENGGNGAVRDFIDYLFDNE